MNTALLAPTVVAYTVFLAVTLVQCEAGLVPGRWERARRLALEAVAWASGFAFIVCWGVMFAGARY